MGLALIPNVIPRVAKTLYFPLFLFWVTSRRFESIDGRFGLLHEPVDGLAGPVATRVKASGTGFAICLETVDVEAAVAKAVGAGAVSKGEAAEGDGACCGGRVGKVRDPYGFVWMICSPAEKCGDVEAMPLAV